jgi:hypothetical protein
MRDIVNHTDSFIHPLGIAVAVVTGAGAVVQSAHPLQQDHHQQS